MKNQYALIEKLVQSFKKIQLKKLTYKCKYYRAIILISLIKIQDYKV